MALALIGGGLGDDFFGPLFPGFSSANQLERMGGQQSGRGIALDVIENDKRFEIKADIPGVDKEDIKLSVDNDVLSLSVHKEQEREEDKEEGGIKWHRAERSTMFVKRAVRIPQNADLTHIKAKYDQGVLHLTIPKVNQEARSRHITIE